jgi:hypothetical protein
MAGKKKDIKKDRVRGEFQNVDTQKITDADQAAIDRVDYLARTKLQTEDVNKWNQVKSKL